MKKGDKIEVSKEEWGCMLRKTDLRRAKDHGGKFEIEEWCIFCDEYQTNTPKIGIDCGKCPFKLVTGFDYGCMLKFGEYIGIGHNFIWWKSYWDEHARKEIRMFRKWIKATFEMKEAK